VKKGQYDEIRRYLGYSGWIVDSRFRAAYYVCSGQSPVAMFAGDHHEQFIFRKNPEIETLWHACGGDTTVPIEKYIGVLAKIERAIARERMQLPIEIVSPYVYDGATVLELGPGRGRFTKSLLQLVGPSGRVVALDVWGKTINRLKRRAAKFGFAERLDARVVATDLLAIPDLNNSIDFTFAFAMVHEVGTPARLFREVAAASKPGASLLLAEPKNVVGPRQFEEEVQAAMQAGFNLLARPTIRHVYAALFNSI
jgi:ubiquinone/menaquinone biosynthesis C-methylase UbiE